MSLQEETGSGFLRTQCLPTSSGKKTHGQLLARALRTPDPLLEPQCPTKALLQCPGDSAFSLGTSPYTTANSMVGKAQHFGGLTSPYKKKKKWKGRHGSEPNSPVLGALPGKHLVLCGSIPNAVFPWGKEAGARHPLRNWVLGAGEA